MLPFCKILASDDNYASIVHTLGKNKYTQGTSFMLKCTIVNELPVQDWSSLNNTLLLPLPLFFAQCYKSMSHWLDLISLKQDLIKFTYTHKMASKSQTTENDISITFNTPSSYDGPPETKPKKDDSKKQSKVLYLTQGFIRFKPGSTSAEKKAYWQSRKQGDNPESLEPEAKKAKVHSDSWCFYNYKNVEKHIQLYASQAISVVRKLPSGFEALKKKDTAYFDIIAESKYQQILLEVYFYKDKYYLSLTKYFKPDDKAEDEYCEWQHSGCNFPFDPEKDDPMNILDFILTPGSN